MRSFFAESLLFFGLFLPVVLGAQVLGGQALNVADKTQVAKVNSQPITSGDMNQLILTDPQFYQLYQNSQSSPEQTKRMRSLILDALIDRAILLEQAEKSNLAKDTKTLQMRVAEIEQRNGGAAKLKAAIEKRGANYEAFKSNVANDILIAEFIKDSWGSQISVSDSEALDKFKNNSEKFDTPAQVHARHILITVDKSAPQAKQDEAAKEIKNIHSQAKAKPDTFADLARTNSKCPSAASGGDLGFFSAKQMVPEFSKSAFALKPGEISEPVQTQFGWHIIKAEEVKPAAKADFESSKELIVQELKAEKLSKVAEEKMATLRASAKIERSAEFATK